MENKINIAELLKNCPAGMELDCAMFENLEFDHINKDNGAYNIICRVKSGCGYYNTHTFTEYGCYSTEKYSKCVIFPKGKTTWEGFQRPFKDGDIVVNASNKKSRAFIYAGEDDTYYHCYVGLSADTDLDLYARISHAWVCKRSGIRFATEEEKQTLFDIIKENGYRWDAKTKTLKKLDEPKFKVGDRIKSKYNNFQYDVTALTDTHYTLVEVEEKFKYTEPICEDKNWELVPNKFDINTLVPFESRVLVRNSYDGFWMPTFWGIYEAEKANRHLYRNYLTTKGFFLHCIPYNDDTKHLVGKTDDCDDYYKTWE